MSMLLWPSLALNGLFLLAALLFIRRKGGLRYLKSLLAARGLVRDRLKERLENAYGLTKSELFASYGVTPEQTVFLGDSLTDFCAWHELFGDATLVNRGISGDTTAGVLSRLSAVVGGHPKAICLMVGINDVNNGDTVDAIASRYQTIVERIRRESPETRLLLQSVLPVDTGRWGFQAGDRIRELNTRIAALADGQQVVFVDLYAHFAENDRLPEALSYDGLHLNGAGYARWRDAIAPLLREI